MNIPNGYKLVPVKATDDMVIAFAETWYSKRQAYDDPDMDDAYRDMLAAAPTPPQPIYDEAKDRADNALKAFANDMITAAFEGGSFDGGDIQDIAVKHGLLRIEQRTEECGDVCACRSEGDGFPAECYRKTALLRGDQPAPVAVVMPERVAADHLNEIAQGWNACLDEVKRLNTND